MQRAPNRCWDPDLHQEPHVYRMLEASVPPGWRRVYCLAGGEPACHPAALAHTRACLLWCFFVLWLCSINAAANCGSARLDMLSGRHPGAKRCLALPSPAFCSFANPRIAWPLLQAVSHYGEALKAIVNEKFGDGIMSGVGLFFILFSLHFSVHPMQPPERCAAPTSARLEVISAHACCCPSAHGIL